MIVENNNVDGVCCVYIEAVRCLLASAGMMAGDGNMQPVCYTCLFTAVGSGSAFKFF